MVNDELTTNADCSANTSFQIEHHKDNNTNFPLIVDMSVQTNLTLYRIVSDEDIEFVLILNAYFKKPMCKSISDSIQVQSGEQPGSHLEIPFPGAYPYHALFV